MLAFLSSRKNVFSVILLPGVIELSGSQNVLQGALGCREVLPGTGDPRLPPLTTNFRFRKLISN